MSTLAADKLGYLPNAGAYYSITAMGSKLFSKLTINELFWGYKDPLVSIANTLLPGWIDFGKLGVLDRVNLNHVLSLFISSDPIMILISK